jgi:hypothetical protein
VKSVAPAAKDFCRAEIDRMLKNSQTKVIAPVITFALLRKHAKTGKIEFSGSEIRKSYDAAVEFLKNFLHHDVHIGARYYDAYGSRMSRYHVLRPIGHLKYELLPLFTDEAEKLVRWIPKRIKQHIDERLGIVPLLKDSSTRTRLAESPEKFQRLLCDQIDRTPANFEIFGFALIKVHLERFACRIYRDTRTASHDKGVDLSTNFGVVYQIKRIRIFTQSEANQIYAELKVNFDNDRLQEGNVVLVIDDISKKIKKYLIDMKVQSFSKADLLKLAANFDEPEDRQKVLRIVYEEFRRECILKRLRAEFEKLTS